MTTRKLNRTTPFVPINTILFATDFSSYSEKALDYTATLARALKAEVLVFHAIAELGLAREDEDPGIREWCDRLEEKMRAKLAETVKCFKDRKLRARGDLRWGSAWRCVLSIVREEPVGMVVVGSHRISDVGDRLRLGTTSHRLALAAPVPVLIVRPEEEEALTVEASK